MAALSPCQAGALRYVGDYQMRIAGAESNVAVGLAKLEIEAHGFPGWGRMSWDALFGTRLGAKGWTAGTWFLTRSTARDCC